MKMFVDVEIRVERELTELDKFAIEVAKLLEKCGRYVIVSGYVAIVMGRTRGTEDIDFLFEGSFSCIDRNLRGFWCLNSESVEKAISDEIIPRIAFKDRVIPNAEIKPIKNEVEAEAMKNRVKLVIGDNEIWISPIDLQIAYKIWLGSDKDIEDAIYLYEYFKESVDLGKVADYLKSLGVKNAEKRIREILG